VRLLRSPTRRRNPLLLPALLLAVVVAAPALVRLHADVLWFGELGYSRILATELVTRAALFAGVTVLAFAILYANARVAQRGRSFRPILVPGLDGDPRDVSGLLWRATVWAAVGLSVLCGLAVTGGWLTVLRALHATPFDLADPVFGRDVGYYVFALPVVAGTQALLFAVLFVALLLSAASYAARGELGRTPGGSLRATLASGRHLAVLGALLLATTAAGIWLVRLPALLQSTTGPLVGASYSDLLAGRPGLHVSAAAALAAAAWLLVQAWRGRAVRGAIGAVGGFALVSVLARVLVPAAVQRLVVDPTELTREAPSLRRHIEMTRRAWGLDRVERRELSGIARIGAAEVAANHATVENVRLWDVEPLLQTFGQLQEIRTYYDFVSVDDDRYWIDGRYRQVLLSPRELNPASLPTRTFINEHLTFTHGMGLTLAPVNQTTVEGLPVLFLRDLPPRSTVDLQVTRPQIYFGELTNTHVFVGTKQREFDYPAGEENVFTAYRGKAGVPVGGVLRRSLLAAYFGSTKVLLSGDITAGSRVLYHRNIAERAAKALPFLRFDSDPYLVIRADGTLVWLLDAYTHSERFPYAARLTDGTSYLRNSVKVTIDAYDGTVAAYVADPVDPIVRTYRKAFPGILRDLREMPADVRAHVRYPGELYRTQMGLYTVYHMDDPEELYHREDQWQVPTMQQGAGEVPFMRRIIMRLPQERGEEYIHMTPFTPRGKDNLTAWVVARSDGEHYGKLVEYRFPRQSLVFGPRQVLNRINQDTEVSRQLSLWDQRGSTVIRGELMVIPIQEALVYVQPIFLRAEGGRIPELKRVVVSYENRVVMEETLEEGLGRIFGAGATPAAPAAAGAGGERPVAGPAPAGEGQEPGSPSRQAPAPAGEASLAARARAHYDRALEAQRAGDWARYGEEIRLLGEVLQQMAPPGAAGGPPQD
jgi:uncharacterized membrane protein (UPF0182 family)